MKPYYNGNNIDDNYLLLSFSLDSLNEQPNGFLNFNNNLNNISIKTILNSTDEPLFLKIILKEYKFLHF